MNNSRTFVSAGLALLSVCAFAQTGVGMAPLAKSPPKAMFGALPLGAKPSSDVLHISLSLTSNDPVGLQSFVDKVSDPKSPMYRHFLSPEDVGKSFGLPASDVAKVSAYLKSKGMTVRLEAKNRLAILADATVAQAEAAFNVVIERFAIYPTGLTDIGERYSFTTPPEFPANLAAKVVDVSGLENFTRPKHHGVTPAQLKTLYGISAIYAIGSKGQGRTIAISSWDGFRVSNEVLECKNAPLPVPDGGAGSNITVVPVNSGTGPTGYEYGEADLDIQASIAMAPLCNLLVYDNYEADGSADLIAVLTQEANDDKADVITESYGWNLDAPTLLAAHNQHLAMGAQGITYMAASGDSGTSLQPYSYPGTDPEVLSVGGTTVSVTASGGRVSEVGWNSFGYAGGGGWAPTTDPFNVRPPYQLTDTFLANPGVPSASAVPYRMIPDLSLDADPATGYYVWFSGGVQIFGGTSGASPTCAGGLADVEQQLITDGFMSADASGHYRLGRLQDLFYSYNGDPGVFYDVVSGSNGTLPSGKSSVAGPGWDTDTGWGAIAFSGLVAKIEGIPQVSSLKLSSNAVSGGAPVTATLTLTSPAAQNGTVVTVTSSGSDLQVPATVTFPAGSTSITFPVMTNGVAKQETLSITATNAFGLETASLILFPARYAGLSVSPSSIAGGSTATGTVSLQGAASASGFVVYLSSSSRLASVPASVTVPANATSVTFPVSTARVGTASTVTITGVASNSQTYTVTLTVRTPIVQQVYLDAQAVVGGSGTTVTGTVTLDGPARAGGETVMLMSSNPKVASVPAAVRVPAGKTMANFAVVHSLVPMGQTVTLAGTLGSGASSATLSVAPFQVVSLLATPSSIAGRSTCQGEVVLNAPIGPRSGTRVIILSDSPALIVPSTVTIPLGSSVGIFTIRSTAVASDTVVTLSTGLNGSAQSTQVTVVAAGLMSVSVRPSVVRGSSTAVVTGTVTLNGPAPEGGTVVMLSSSNTSAAEVPDSVTVPAGRTSATFTVTHHRVDASSQVTISATTGSVTQKAILTVSGG